MGDIADYYIDQMMDGPGSDWNTFYGEPQGAYRNDPVCRFCGRQAEWRNDGQKWYLASSTGYAHKCKQSDLDTIALLDFKDLTK